MKTLKFLTYAFLAIFLSLTSCSDDGEDGIDGVDGIDGIDGVDGATGADGNANVIASDWIPTAFEGGSTTVDSFIIDDPLFTQEVLDSSVFLMYCSSRSSFY